MIIQIRIIVDVPEGDKLKYPTAIEKIVNCALEEFPELKIARPHSPVTVTIKELEVKVQAT